MDRIREIAKDGYKFEIKFILLKAFEIIKQNTLLLSLYSSIYILFSFYCIRLGYWGILLQSIMSGPVIAGYFSAFYESENAKIINLKSLFFGLINPLPFISIILLTSILSALGLWIFILPGVYLIIAYFFAIPFFMFKNFSYWDSIEASRLIITKRFFKFTLLILILLAMNILGAFLYGIGLIFTIPYTYASIYVAFKSIFPEIIQKNADVENEDKLDFTMFR